MALQNITEEIIWAILTKTLLQLFIFLVNLPPLSPTLKKYTHTHTEKMCNLHQQNCRGHCQKIGKQCTPQISSNRMPVPRTILPASHEGC